MLSRYEHLMSFRGAELGSQNSWQTAQNHIYVAPVPRDLMPLAPVDTYTQECIPICKYTHTHTYALTPTHN